MICGAQAPIYDEAGRTACCVARCIEGLPHMGTGLPVLPGLQNYPPHSYSIRRLYTAGSPTSSGSTPRLPDYIRAQRPREVHTRLPPSGHNTMGFGAPLQRPLPGPVMEREDIATPHARQVRPRVNRHSQAGLQDE
jgi:hypothetical protein